jgi:ribosomal protein S24E
MPCMSMILSPDDYKSAVRELLDEYGSATDIPPGEVESLSERLRAFYVTQLPEFVQPSSWAAAFKAYNIRQSIWAGELDIAEAAKKKARHADKNKALRTWVDESAGKIVRVDELAEACGVSTSKARTFIYDRVDVFSKVGHGLYLVKNPALERELDKQR